MSHPAYPPPPDPSWGQLPVPSTRPEHPHPEPRSYPLMLRTWTYSWWKPVVGILLFLVGALIVFPLVLIPVLLIGVYVETGGQDYLDALIEATSFESVTPSSMLYLNLSLAALIPLSMLLLRVLHGMRPRWLSSVQPFLRWKFLFACTGIAVGCMVLSVLVGLLLPTDPSGAEGATASVPSGEMLAIAVIILLTTPLQAIGEEYGFRGYLMQAFGSLFNNPWAAVVITAFLFALAHGAQNFPLFFDRLTFGLIAGATVVLLGGLEAGIAMHVVNNLVAFGFAIAYDQLDGALTIAEVSWWQIPVTITQHGSYLLLVLLLARRMRLQRLTTPPATSSSTPAVPLG